MGFFSRLFTWGKSEMNDTMDKLEDPIKMTDQGIKDLEQNLDKSIKSLASVKASCITAKRDLDKANEEIASYESKAMALLKAADAGKISQEEAERLATQCLEKKSNKTKDLVVLQQNYDKYNAAVAKLESSVKQLKTQIDKWKNESKMLKARAKVSEATANVNKQLAGIDSTDTLSMLERMKEKVDQQEALADSYLEIAEQSQSADKEIDSVLKEIGGSVEASNELAALKAKMAQTKAIESSVEEPKAISNSSVSELDLLKQRMTEAQPQEATSSSQGERPMQQADQSPMK